MRIHNRATIRSVLLTSVATAACLAAPGFALAQSAASKTATAAATATVDVGEVVVTGSRIPRPNDDQPTPVQLVNSDDIQASGVTNLGDIISQIPALGFIGSIRGSENGGQASGLDIPNLRNLGAQRTLTLVDGQRHVAGTAGQAGVDLGSIPPSLVDRVEVTTGGSSAIYGSDAVSGVVNILTKKNLQGVEADFTAGSAFAGYDKDYNISISVGNNFADGRGNAVFSVLYDHSDAVSRDQIKTLRNGGTIVNFADCATPRALSSLTSCTPKPNDGIPDSFVVSNVGSEVISPNGVLSPFGVGNLNSLIGFDRAGNPVVQPARTGFNSALFGQLPSNCTSCFFGQDFQDIVPEITRKGFFTNLRYEVTPNIELTVDAKYVNTQDTTLFQPSFVAGSISPNDGSNKTFTTKIAPDNAFRTPALNAFINAAAGQNLNNTSLPYSAFIGPARGDTTTRETYRLVTGLNGKFDLPLAEFHYDAALNYGETKNSFADHGELLDGNFRASLDSVIDPATGKAACRINVVSAQPTGFAAPTGITQNPANCVPFNPFGQQNSAAFFKWAESDLNESARITQQVANANFRFDTSRFFNLQGGPLSIAFGGEYRRETSINANDALALQGLTFAAAAPTAPGVFNVSEGYIEIQAPLLKHYAFAEELSVGGATRQASYNPFGNVNTWDLNFLYEPFARDLSGWKSAFSGIRLRGTLSSATRAPNIDEAFRPISPGFSNITDPCDSLNIGLNVNRRANCAALGLPAVFNSNTNASINTVTSGGLVNGTGTLRNETAHTYTLGLVYQPQWVPSLVFSADYYNINILDAITLPAIQTIINNCVDGPTLNQQFCGLITRLPSTDPLRPLNISTVNSQFLNAAAVRTHGVDFQLSYSRNVADWTQNLPVLQHLDGRLSGAVVVDWVQANRNIPFQEFPNIQNIFEGTVGIPSEKGTLNLTYAQGDWTVGYRGRYVSRTALFVRDGTRVEFCESISPCQIPAQYYSDIDVTYKLKSFGYNMEIQGGIKNIFNTQIPLHGDVTSAEYEIFGTTGFISLRVKQ
ncbi:TonB-dependent receptor plug domain-containing protein [Phenylobacterium sp.]|uniref:TonB-dependent receptor plug domain-containing protein n=1 Tax=Phenylobacterium sp. TaxID=1871053 RepID=UPI002C24B776|nr:TonB-dependent receptor plug domain-containing protein [Phenylobacterium sp.]HLZ74713.1 TonB-dependent receptor plug domain-containing protein [Phenylobacterium sp.]